MDRLLRPSPKPGAQTGFSSSAVSDDRKAYNKLERQDTHPQGSTDDDEELVPDTTCLEELLQEDVQHSCEYVLKLIMGEEKEALQIMTQKIRFSDTEKRFLEEQQRKKAERSKIDEATADRILDQSVCPFVSGKKEADAKMPGDGGYGGMSRSGKVLMPQSRIQKNKQKKKRH